MTKKKDRPSLTNIMESRKDADAGKGKPGPAPDPDSLTARLERGQVSQLKVLIPEDLHTRLKVRAAQTKRTMSEMTAEALEGYLED